jgi:hypothetical protein
MRRHWDALAERFVYRSSGAQDFGQSQIGVRGAQEANRERAHGIMGRVGRYPRDLETSVEARDRKNYGSEVAFCVQAMAISKLQVWAREAFAASKELQSLYPNLGFHSILF